jgi:hypothetical protein
LRRREKSTVVMEMGRYEILGFLKAIDAELLKYAEKG